MRILKVRFQSAPGRGNNTCKGPEADRAGRFEELERGQHGWRAVSRGRHKPAQAGPLQRVDFILNVKKNHHGVKQRNMTAWYFLKDKLGWVWELHQGERKGKWAGAIDENSKDPTDSRRIEEGNYLVIT